MNVSAACLRRDASGTDPSVLLRGVADQDFGLGVRIVTRPRCELPFDGLGHGQASAESSRELSTRVFIEKGQAAERSDKIPSTVTGVTSRSVATPDEASAPKELVEDGERVADAVELAALENPS